MGLEWFRTQHWTVGYECQDVTTITYSEPDVQAAIIGGGWVPAGAVVTVTNEVKADVQQTPLPSNPNTSWCRSKHKCAANASAL